MWTGMQLTFLTPQIIFKHQGAPTISKQSNPLTCSNYLISKVLTFGAWTLFQHSSLVGSYSSPKCLISVCRAVTTPCWVGKYFFLLPGPLNKFKRLIMWCLCVLTYRSWVSQVLSPEMAEMYSRHYLTWCDYLIHHMYHRKLP